MLDNLKELRKETCVSQKSLAEAIGVSQQSINKYENHNIEPDIGTLIRIADFFGVSVDYLIGHTDIRHKIEQVQPWELNKEESELLSGYRKLTEKQRAAVRFVIESHLEP